MSASKPWAYVTQYGPEIVDAWEIKRQRDLIGGATLDKYWWSPHRKGERKRVTHTDRKGAVPHFTYIDGWTPGEGEGGETLSHVLYKKAIARLGKTQLRFPNGETHDIRITHAEMEKTIPLAVGHRVVDVYCKFESDSHLAKKWGGEVCFEVWHTHRTPREKILGMRDRRVPVFEVPVHKLFRYRNENNTSRELEKKHEDFLVGRLGEYMLGKAISDPSSVEYLEERIQIMSAQMVRDAKLAAARCDEVKMHESELGRLKGDNAALAQHNAGLTQRNASLATENALLKKGASEDENAITRLGSDNESLRRINKAQRKSLKYRKYLLIAAGTAFAVCLVYALYISFIVDGVGNDPAPQEAATAQRNTSSANLPERPIALPKPNKKKTVKGKSPVKKSNKNARSVDEELSAPTATPEPSAE